MARGRLHPGPGEERPCSHSPSVGAGGPGPPTSLHLRSRRYHGGSLDRLTLRGPAPLSSGPRSEFGAGQRDCTLGAQGACQNMSLLVIEFGVCHLSFLIWLSACSPYTLPREGAPAEVEDERGGGPGPCLGGPASQFQGLIGWLAGRERVGRMEPLEFLSPAGLHPEHLPLHAACPGTLPGCEEPRIHPCTCSRFLAPPTPSSFVLPNRPSEDPGSFYWALVSVGRIQSLSHLPPGPRLILQGSPKPKIWVELAPMALFLVPALLLGPVHQGTVAYRE